MPVRGEHRTGAQTGNPDHHPTRYLPPFAHPCSQAAPPPNTTHSGWGQNKLSPTQPSHRTNGLRVEPQRFLQVGPENLPTDTRRFADLRTDYDVNIDAFQPIPLQPLGDESAAYRHTIVNAEEAEAGVLVGTVVTWVSYETQDDILDSSHLTALARMLADRAQQAQNGSTPSARAEI